MRQRRSSRTTLVPGDGPLHRIPPAAAFVTVIVLFGLGLWLGGVAGVILLGVLCVGVLVLLAGTWHTLQSAERILRIAVLLILVAVAISRLR